MPELGVIGGAAAPSPTLAAAENTRRRTEERMRAPQAAYESCFELLFVHAIDGDNLAVDGDNGNLDRPTPRELIIGFNVDALDLFTCERGDARDYLGCFLAQVTAGPFEKHNSRAARGNKARLGGSLGGCHAAAGAVNSTSIVIVTVSPTRTPPASRAAFHVRPKSLREILVVAEKPAR